MHDAPCKLSPMQGAPMQGLPCKLSYAGCSRTHQIQLLLGVIILKDVDGRETQGHTLPHLATHIPAANHSNNNSNSI